jgi:hypothetical protein
MWSVLFGCGTDRNNDDCFRMQTGFCLLPGQVFEQDSFFLGGSVLSSERTVYSMSFESLINEWQALNLS